MLRVAFAGTFSARLEAQVRARLAIPCDVILDDENGIVSRLPEVDVLVTLAFTREMGGAARRLKLVQVPGAGLDRIDRSALPAGTWLANANGHEVGIAESQGRRSVSSANVGSGRPSPGERGRSTWPCGPSDAT